MTKQSPQTCEQCGAELDPAAAECPNGHPVRAGAEAADGSIETAAINSDPLVQLLRELDATDDLSDVDTALQEGGFPNTLFECLPCGRLVETQRHYERTVVPRFCPWCSRPVSPLLGREIDGYRLDSTLARGGFGIVYLASNIAQPKMKAVVKVLRPELSYRRPELVRIFVEEARLTEEIGQKCWNVVRVSNVRERPWPYFFMEYVRGTTLEDYITSLGETGVPLEECSGFLRGIANALAATHAHGRVHRDLKPANLMIIQSTEISRHEDRVKLLDFGLAMKIASVRVNIDRKEASESSLSSYLDQVDSPVQSAGTPEYMPPEAFDGINEFGGDIYSFGVTAYEILTGEKPWKDPTLGTNRFFYWREVHKKVAPRPLREIRPDTPSWLAKVVMKCLEKNPRQRLQSTEQLFERLRQPLPAWTWIIAAVALLVATLGWLLYFQRTDVQTVHSWNLGEDRLPNPLQLWVRDDADLANRRPSATLRGVKLSSCQTDNELVECHVVDDGDRLELRFAADLALEGKPVRVEGSGEGVRVEGSVVVNVDAEKPSVGALEMVTVNQEAHSLDGETRLHPAHVRLQALIRDNHGVDAAFLKLTPLASARANATAPPIRGELTQEKSTRDLWTFPLESSAVSSIEPGQYRAAVVALDRAKNTTSSRAVELHIDKSVDLASPRDGQEASFITGGRLFYRFSSREPLTAVQTAPAKDTNWTTETLLEMPTPLRDALQLSQSLPLRRVEVEQLESGVTYLLPVSIPAVATTVETRLRVADSALPPNETVIRLRGSLPERLSGADIEKLTLTAAGSDRGISADEVSAKDKRVYRCPPLNTTVVESLRVDFPAGRVHAANLRRSDGTTISPKELSSAHLTFGKLTLPENQDTTLSLQLQDPVGRTFSVSLKLTTDLNRPELQVVTDFADKAHQSVKTWDDVRLVVTAEEPLESVRVTAAGKELKTQRLSPLRFAIDLSVLDIREGRLPLRVSGRDIAGNTTLLSSPRAPTLLINTAPPRVQPTLTRRPDGTLVLDKNEILVEIRDGNGIDYSHAVASYRWRADARESGWQRTKIQAPADSGSPVHRIPLTIEPDECKVELRLVVPDTLGLTLDQTWSLEFQRPKPDWEDVVKWEGVEWIRIKKPGDESFYISRDEISNAVFNHRKAIQNGLYRFDGAPQKRPRYWGKDGALPKYQNLVTKRKARGDRFPVVGVSPQAAEKFAELVFAGRLPTYDEWLLAARQGGRLNGRYPWSDETDIGRSVANCFGAWEKPASPLREFVYEMRPANGTSVRCRVTRVNFDPLAQLEARVREKLRYTGHLRHVIGNVGELVRMEGRAADKGISYRVAGGDFDTAYDRVNLRVSDEWNPKDYTQPGAQIGFRVVISLDEGPHPEFLERARKRGGRR